MGSDPFVGAWDSPASQLSGLSVAGCLDPEDLPRYPHRAQVVAITQADLARLRSLVDRRNQLTREYEAHRDDIAERYLRSGFVEPGPLDLTITQYEVRQFTRDQLERLLGTRETERLHCLLIPKSQTRVRVVNAK